MRFKSNGSLKAAILPPRIKARAPLFHTRPQLVMPQNLCLRIIPFQLPQQVHQRAFLRIRARIGGTSFFGESTFVADADALVVPAGGVGAYLMHGAADVHLAVAGDVEMIADVGKAAGEMAAAQGGERKVAIATCGAAMNYQEADLPIVLVETA